MIAEGTYSNPQDAYFDAQDNQAPRLSMLPLNWDQTHTLNFRATTGGKTGLQVLLASCGQVSPTPPNLKPALFPDQELLQGLLIIANVNQMFLI